MPFALLLFLTHSLSLSSSVSLWFLLFYFIFFVTLVSFVHSLTIYSLHFLKKMQSIHQFFVRIGTNACLNLAFDFLWHSFRKIHFFFFLYSSSFSFSCGCCCCCWMEMWQYSNQIAADIDINDALNYVEFCHKDILMRIGK